MISCEAVCKYLNIPMVDSDIEFTSEEFISIAMRFELGFKRFSDKKLLKILNFIMNQEGEIGTRFVKKSFVGLTKNENSVIGLDGNKQLLDALYAVIKNNPSLVYKLAAEMGLVEFTRQCDIENSYREIVAKRPTYFEPTEYQRELIESLKYQLEDSKDRRALLNIPTGAGKTKTTMEYLVEFLERNGPATIIWWTFSGELLDQAARSFKEVYKEKGSEDVILTLLENNVNTSVLEDFDSFGLSNIIFMNVQNRIQLMAETPPRFMETVAMHIVDEYHNLSGLYYESLRKLLEVSSEDRLLGLSATPLNNQGINLVNLDAFVPFPMTADQWLIREGYLSVCTETRHTNLGSLAGVAQRIFELTQPEDKVLVFAKSVKQSQEIGLRLHMLGRNSFHLDGQTDASLRRKIVEIMRSPGEGIIVCNYRVLTTGFDAPTADKAFTVNKRQMPEHEARQIKGRVIRGAKFGGTETAEIHHLEF